MKERLQKIIADAGISSRRKAEELIREGRVRISGRVVTKLGTKADPERESIEVDGQFLSARTPERVYIALHKPRGYITSRQDPEGRSTVTELLRGVPERVFPVGRLDYDAEGLLLLTNDGELAQRLLHPRYAVPRTYLVKVKGLPDAQSITRLRRGVVLSDGVSLPARVSFIERTQKNSWVRITVTEGRNRLIKRMCATVGHPVLKLKRVAFGRLELGSLQPGNFRVLSAREVERLFLTRKSGSSQPAREDG
jgi:23S rRNA pseudouridine2605 synthase